MSDASKKGIEELTVNTIRTLAMDAVQKANSGHPGAPMGLAPAAYVVWHNHLRHNPKNPDWHDRDRFILSNGHASMLLYAMLHLTGYEQMTLEQIENFRQWDSATPGHPENFETEGVEMTTGPLGQGFATAVGMALSEAQLNERFDGVVDHFTYVFCSDGDLMEGISHEAASLAGHLGLGKLVYIFDDNSITIDGGTDLTFTEDVQKRFEAYGWHVQTVEDGNDLDAIDEAVEAAKQVTDKPSIIALRTVIGYGSPNKAGKSSSHGSPLGDDEIAATKAALGWEYDEPFFVPEEVQAHMSAAVDRGHQLESEWADRLEKYAEEAPEKYAELTRRLAGKLPEGWDADLPTFEPDAKGMATRKSSGAVVKELYAKLPEFTGGSADLAGSNKTLFEEFGIMSPGHFDAQNIHFGVREHAMFAIANGMTLHGGTRGFGATFLIFSDYMRPALRLAALMQTPSIGVFTHDSIGLGEDGPTHQPIEHLASLRAMPNMTVLRPADANEVRECWQVAIENTTGPSSLALTRQSVPTLDREALGSVGDATKGAYILADSDADEPEVILMASGSEVAVCLDAYKKLTDEGVAARVVSMPSWEVFEAQDDAWKEQVLPKSVTKRVAVEAAATFGWERYTGWDGHVHGLDRFGKSAPAGEVFEKLGFTGDNIAELAKGLL
ncbi:transketolase [Persicimonas caeni]|uniref:Transketolase n=1 Tax=Persicimonas caeni TaxID=2292766 RepID=A0A4Y6PRS2_PERCE|nr:transketolase [Persicimonas caeni]QDG51044.1 transketolase [Persicimonas caeni]QED32265.1 transketolase [Persicimonas caeni]